jgi:hypothetical protein
LPDVAQLANLANAFFSALPGQLPGSASGANGLNLDVAGPQLCRRNRLRWMALAVVARMPMPCLRAMARPFRNWPPPSLRPVSCRCRRAVLAVLLYRRVLGLSGIVQQFAGG